MPNLRDEIKVNLESVLGVEAHFKSAFELKVPFHIKDAYKPVNLRGTIERLTVSFGLQPQEA